MSERIKFDVEKEAPIISITFIGTLRIEYGLTLNDPNSQGSWLGHWTGDNKSQDKVEYPAIPERPNLPSLKWEFAGLDWLFITWPNPGIQERYEIRLTIEQEGTEIYSKKYEGEPSNPIQDVGRVIFIPNN